MSIKIESPATRWPGTITLKDSIGYPALIEWLAIADKASGVYKEKIVAAEEAAGDEKNKLNQSAFLEFNRTIIPGIILFVEKWELGGAFPVVVTAESFPSVPVNDSDQLITALIAAIRKVIAGNNDPNA